MTTNDDLTVKSEDGSDVRTITHTNGDVTIVPGDVDDETAAQLAALTGDDIADAVADVVEKKDREAAEKDVAAATSTVLSDPPDASTSSTAGQAGPDPVRQGGPSAPVVDVPRPQFSGDDPETVKAREAAERQADKDDPSAT